ncbi:MAG: ABC transporter substrate-binding protein [Nitrospiraceae bacterium]|nr:ABC transporter substrate-binding protein [Nitrospiraceae bacterium]
MKRFLVILTVVALILASFPGLVRANETSLKDISLILKVGEKSYMLNGFEKTSDAGPIIKNSRAFVPIRLVAEEFGAKVGWDNATRTVTIQANSTTIKLVIGSTAAYVGNKKYTLDYPIFIAPPGRTMVPIRFVSESLGLLVFWDAAGRQIYISSPTHVKSPGVTDSEITIGTFQALSGPVAPIGIAVSHGMQAYFNMINEQGGIYGRKINLIIRDDQFNPAKTVLETKRLVEQDHVFAIVGGLGTPGCLAVTDYLENKGVPFIYQGSGSSKFAFPPKKYIFSVQPNYLNEGQIMVKYALNDLKAKNIAVIYEDDDIGNEGLEGVKKGIDKFGGKLVTSIGFPLTETDFTSYILKLQQAKPDVVIVYALLRPATAILKTARNLGLDTKFMTTYPNADPVFILLSGGAAENVYVAAWVDITNTKDPGVVKFFTAMQKYYPKEKGVAYAAAGWIAAEVFTEALRRAGAPPTRERLVWALETFKHWNGDLAKDITYGKTERAGKYSMYFLQVKNGKFVKASSWINIYEDKP